MSHTAEFPVVTWPFPGPHGVCQDETDRATTAGRQARRGVEDSGVDSAAGHVGAAAERDFDEFYAAHFRSVAVQLYGYVGDTSEAQDIAQEAFCRAWQRWRTVAGYDEPVAWVRRVAWNLATSRWRRARTALAFLRRHREESVPEISPDRLALVAAMKRLPDNQRRAVVLHYLGDCPVAEVAEMMGVPPGTVKSWLHRGRAALAALLAEDPEPGAESTEGVTARA